MERRVTTQTNAYRGCVTPGCANNALRRIFASDSDFCSRCGGALGERRNPVTVSGRPASFVQVMTEASDNTVVTAPRQAAAEHSGHLPAWCYDRLVLHDETADADAQVWHDRYDGIADADVR